MAEVSHTYSKPMIQRQSNQTTTSLSQWNTIRGLSTDHIVAENDPKIVRELALYIKQRETPIKTSPSPNRSPTIKKEESMSPDNEPVEGTITGRRAPVPNSLLAKQGVKTEGRKRTNDVSV